MNEPPIAIADVTPSSVAYVNQEIVLDASRSSDPEGNELLFFWDFGDGETSGWTDEEVITHSYSEPGEYVIKLIVNDGKLNSTPYYINLTILPEMQNRIALICGSDKCEGSLENELLKFLEENGYDVMSKPEKLWKDELNEYDLMICASTKGCNLHLWLKPYYYHVYERKGFIEIPVYKYVRAAYRFKYVRGWNGYTVSSAKVEILPHELTTGYEDMQFTSSTLLGIFGRRIRVGIELMKGDGLVPQFVVEPFDKRGRYAFIGWVYKTSLAELSEQEKELLLRTIRWVQCGDPDGCE